MRSKFEDLYIALILIIMIFATSACGSTKLLDIDKTAKRLSFTEAQLETIQPKVEQIEKIVEGYKLEKKTLESELNEMRNQMRAGRGGGGFGGPRGSSGGRPGGGTRSGFQNRIQAFYKQRTAYQKQIDALVAKIKGLLDEDQQQAFADIKLPELEMPEVVRGGGGGGRRRGGGGGFGGR